jgi:hypothetical protein
MKFRFAAFFHDGSIERLDLDGTDRCDHPEFTRVIREFEARRGLLDIMVTYQPNASAPFQMVAKNG